MKKAAFIKELPINNAGAIQRLYRLNPPMPAPDWDEDANPAEYVIVSAVIAMFSGPETYIFPSDENGNIIDWGELNGSYRGGLCHERALERAGYEVCS